MLMQTSLQRNINMGIYKNLLLIYMPKCKNHRFNGTIRLKNNEE
jgi:hypothetical protein